MGHINNLKLMKKGWECFEDKARLLFRKKFRESQGLFQEVPSRAAVSFFGVYPRDGSQMTQSTSRLWMLMSATACSGVDPGRIPSLFPYRHQPPLHDPMTPETGLSLNWVSKLAANPDPDPSAARLISVTSVGNYSFKLP